MTTILQQPDSLSLASNMKKFEITSSQEVRFKLSVDAVILLDESYSPDPTGRVVIDVRDVVKSELSLDLPSSDIFQQTDICKLFTAEIDATIITFLAIRSGVENFFDTPTNFLTSNWLTWQPQTKKVSYYQPEWLTYYAPVSGIVKVRFYLKDDTKPVISLHNIPSGSCYTYNMNFAHIMSLQEGDKFGYYDVWVENATGDRLTYIQRYIYSEPNSLDEFFCFENSLGGLDTVLMSGDSSFVPEMGHEAGEYDDENVQLDGTITRLRSKNTGWKDREEAEWLWDFFTSHFRYKVVSGSLSKITLSESDIQDSVQEDLKAYTFTYRLSVDQGLLNIVRSTDPLPDDLEITTPEGLFFLAPRLEDFPAAVADDTLLFPVQSPYSGIWKKFSWGSIWNFLYTKLLESAIGLAAHVHANFSVLSKLSEDSGKLLYNGASVSGSGGSGVVLGETSATAYRGDRGAQMYKERKKSALPNGYGTLILTDIPALEDHNISIKITGMGLGGFQPFSMIAQARTTVDGFLSNHFKAIACGQKLNLYAFRIIPEGKESHVVAFWVSHTTTTMNSFLLYNELTVIADGTIINHITETDDSPLPSNDESYADGNSFRDITGAVKDLDVVDLSNYYTKTQSDTRYPILSSGKILAANLPSYVDDVIEGIYVNPTTFTVSGSAITPETGKIYVSVDTNLNYRWSGSVFVIMSTSLALGETEATAYRGDRGKIAFDHSQNGDFHVTPEIKTELENATWAATPNTHVKRDSYGKSAFVAIIINGIELTVE